MEEMNRLKELNAEGFIPGPSETFEDFLQRVQSIKSAFFKLGARSIPEAHWQYTNLSLQNLFDFSPKCLPAFYANTHLMPWQAAVAWVERDLLIAIQLRKAFEKGSFLKLYSRHEILAHEAVHAARSAFPHDRFDEVFAYMTSQRRWIQVLGPIIKSPWEVWPFLVFSVLGMLDPLFFLGRLVWSLLGFYRLIQSQYLLRKAYKNVSLEGFSPHQTRSILMRLTAKEIQKLAEGVKIYQLYFENQTQIRWQMIQFCYLHKTEK